MEASHGVTHDKNEKLKELVDVNVIDAILTLFITVLIIYAVYCEFDAAAVILSLALIVLIYFGFSKYLHTFVHKDALIWTVIGVFVVFVVSFETTKASKGFYMLLIALFFACLLFMFVKHTIFLLLLIFLFLYIASVLLVYNIEDISI